jgi:hypothetical protein
LVAGYYSGEILLWDIEFTNRGIYFIELEEFSIHDNNHVFRSILSIVDYGDKKNIICGSHKRIAILSYKPE